MSDRIPMLLTGKQKLETELKRLKSVERPAVIEAIEQARALGDLSENAEYSAAKERQSFIEGRISEIEDRLARADVIDPASLKSDRIVFGATVVLSDEGGTERTYQIVGEEEADIKDNRISIFSPIAKALIGKEVGDTVDVRAPRGIIQYEVLEIRFG